MRLLVIAVIHDIPKRRSLFEDFAFVCIVYERFRFLLSYVKHNEYFEILRIWQNNDSPVDDPVL
ncbi:transposase [Bacillus mycoides]|uniref:transposase n=1 Tax=Bacillus mycoides TaxID=1405 RepID=UPI00338E7B1A